MCDYSLHAIASRPARAAEALISTEFTGTSTRGFAAVDDATIAVCLLPGTEIEFEKEVRARGFLFSRKIGDRMARFRQINTDDPHRHHDALEFSNGILVMVNDLVRGQRARVLQLPADPAKYNRSAEVAATSNPAEAAVNPGSLSASETA